MKQFTNRLCLALLVLIGVEALYFNILVDLGIVTMLLTTALAIGSLVPMKVSLTQINRLLLRLFAGLGILAMLLWLSTFYNIGYKSLFFGASAILIIWRRSNIAMYVRQCARLIAATNRTSPCAIPILLLAFGVYIAAASVPVSHHDSLVQHLPIPLTILNSPNWSYDVTQNVGFGNFALLPHMLYLYLLAFATPKACALLNVVVSFLICLSLMRISRYVNRSNTVITGVVLLYLTTPLIMYLSIILFVDLYPVLFVCGVLAVITPLRPDRIAANSPLLCLLLGIAFFAKPQSLAFIIPCATVIAFSLVFAFVKRRLSVSQTLWRSVLSPFLFLLPFAPAMLVVWHKTGNPVFPFMNGLFKSPYFTTVNFVDGFNSHPLGFNFSSLLSLVFHTSRNTENPDGCLGLAPLLLLAAPIALVLCRKRSFLALLGLVLASYLISISLTYNLRYQMGAIAITTLLAALIVYCLASVLPWKRAVAPLATACILGLIIPNLLFIFHAHRGWVFTGPLRANHAVLSANNANTSVLSAVDNPDVSILSNNDCYKGAFKGRFYTLDWYNDMLLRLVRNRKVSPEDFIRSFDYYLVDKRVPETRYLTGNEFSFANTYMQTNLSLFCESSSHQLYRICRPETCVLRECPVPPISLRAPTNAYYGFDYSEAPCEAKNAGLAKKGHYRGYRIKLTAQGSNGDGCLIVQINWHNAKGKFLDAVQMRLKVQPLPWSYASAVLTDTPKGAAGGVIYLIPEGDFPITVNSLELFGSTGGALQKVFDEYKARWPH